MRARDARTWVVRGWLSEAEGGVQLFISFRLVRNRDDVFGGETNVCPRDIAKRFFGGGPVYPSNLPLRCA